MKIKAWRDEASMMQRLEVEIPFQFAIECCEPLAKPPKQSEAEHILRNAVLHAFGLKLSKPVTHHKKDEPPAKAPEGNLNCLSTTRSAHAKVRSTSR